MSKFRKNYAADEKAKIALEALKGLETMSQLTAKYGVHATQISNWKRRLKEGLSSIFNDQQKSKASSEQALIDELYKQIGQLKVELDWLKKKAELFR